MTSSLEMEWDYSGTKARDGQKKKIGKVNEKRKKGKVKKSKRWGSEWTRGKEDAQVPRRAHKQTESTPKNQQSTVRTAHVCAYHCAQLLYTTQHRTVPIISPLILQTIIIAQMGWAKVWWRWQTAMLFTDHQTFPFICRYGSDQLTTITRWAVSSGSPPLIKMPLMAPTPVPTMTAVGVARPSAHGHAMHSTEMAYLNDRSITSSWKLRPLCDDNNIPITSISPAV